MVMVMVMVMVVVVVVLLDIGAQILMVVLME